MVEVYDAHRKEAVLHKALPPLPVQIPEDEQAELVGVICAGFFEVANTSLVQTQ